MIIQDLIENQNVTEILINSAQEIWYETNGQLCPFENHFLNEQEYESFLQTLTIESKTNLNVERPFASGQWKNFRLQMVGPESANGNFIVSLRRHPNSPWTFAKLIERGWDKNKIDFVEGMINQKENFLIIGPTGSGKTSLITACAQSFPQNERVVIIEDTSEIKIPNKVSVKLLTRPNSFGSLPEIDQTELVKQSLRLRPDRIIVGEVRGNEAKDLLLALSTGHAGSFGSLHAQTAQQALLRLEMLVQMGAPQWSLSTIRHLIFLSLKYIVVVNKTPQGVRGLESIYELSSREDSGLLLHQVL